MCSVDGCDGRVFGHGLCNKHYKKVRKYGDPLHGRVNSERGAPMKWIIDHVDHDGDECLIWPFFRVKGRGYGRIGREFAHRVMCMKVHGAPPSALHQAAHSCGKGHEGCVNPKHLRWDTAKGNNADRIVHGTDGARERNPSVKLSPDQVTKIKALAGTRRCRGRFTQYQVAEMFGVSQSQVSAIVRGASWH